ncbi:MAG TPA: patatin-like phospholipase family protein, partial [Thermodesulfobacteriota bacterium]|nr:patatin-like phospholipase family protein [Thermodesulfobacteriota bacterium]
YDEHVFERKTFGDIAASRAPFILVNATDLSLGSYFTFNQETFDLICSDLSRTPVSRAVAASSAVPMILTPITLDNFAGSCNYEVPGWMKKALEEPSFSRRRSQQAQHLSSYLDLKKRPFIHLVDGGISDNLGLRGAIDSVEARGGIWPSLQHLGWENTRKVVFIIVNAEKEPEPTPDRLERILPTAQVVQAVTRIQMTRYNFETIELLREKFRRWGEEIRLQRCGARANVTAENQPAAERGSCGDIDFYLVEVDFTALKDPSERALFRSLPTSFYLPAGTVDRIRDAGRKILTQAPDFRRLLSDLRD